MSVSVLVTKPKQLMKKDKDLLRENGVIVVETEEPKLIRFLRPEADVEYNDLLYAAIIAVSTARPGHSARDIFAEVMGRIVSDLHDKRKEIAP